MITHPQKKIWLEQCDLIKLIIDKNADKIWNTISDYQQKTIQTHNTLSKINKTTKITHSEKIIPDTLNQDFRKKNKTLSRKINKNPNKTT